MLVKFLVVEQAFLTLSNTECLYACVIFWTMQWSVSSGGRHGTSSHNVCPKWTLKQWCIPNIWQQFPTEYHGVNKGSNNYCRSWWFPLLDVFIPQSVSTTVVNKKLKLNVICIWLPEVFQEEINYRRLVSTGPDPIPSEVSIGIVSNSSFWQYILRKLMLW